jgi:hypothetical protein
MALLASHPRSYDKGGTQVVYGSAATTTVAILGSMVVLVRDNIERRLVSYTMSV